jgi:glycosyltransferase involved in cell wall biosynthesis
MAARCQSRLPFTCFDPSFTVSRFSYHARRDRRARPFDVTADSSRPAIGVVIPMMNARGHLATTVPTVLAAGCRYGPVEFVYVDNGSTDGSFEYLEGFAARGVKRFRLPNARIAAVRNHGAQQVAPKYLSFIDADCAIPEDYFENAVGVIETTGAAATGCGVDLPETPDWIEATWHDLHFVARDRDVSYLNSGNFFVAKSAFDAVGGFREDLWTGEDAEIGLRLRSAGYRIRSSPSVKAIHYGNPKSVRAFYRRTVWHGLGMFGTVTMRSVDKPTAMLFAHLILTALGVALLATMHASLLERIGIFVALQLAVPVATVVYRVSQTRFTRRALPGVALYWLYYWARAQALALVLLGRAKSYRK